MTGVAPPEAAVVVQPVPGCTWAAALFDAARSQPDGVVVLGPPGAAPTASVTELLSDRSLGIGAVVMGTAPAAPSLTAGPASRTTGRWRDVVEGHGPGVAVRAQVVLTAGLGAEVDDPRLIVDLLLRKVVDGGLRTVEDRSWTAPEPATGSSAGGLSAGGLSADGLSAEEPEFAPLATGRTSVPGSSILIATGFVPADPLRGEDRALQALIRDLLTHVEDASITVVAADGFRAGPAAEALRNLGAEVIHGPIDWDAWSRDHALEHSHVIVTWSGLQSGMRTRLQRSQPQAVVTLFLPSLPTGDIDGLRRYVPPQELAGLDYLEREVATSVSSLSGWVDTVWCVRESDATIMRAAGRFGMVSVIPAAPAAPAVEADQRGGGGLVVLATEGHDLLKGNEEAALYLLDELLPPLRRARPDLRCSVLSERPTPRLETTCRTSGAELVPAAATDERLRSADLVIAPHQHGTGGSTAISLAVDAGVPFIASAQAASGVHLGELRALTVFADPEDLRFHARRLLSDPAARQQLRTAIATTVAHGTVRSERRAALSAALAAIGLTPCPDQDRRWPDQVIPAPARPPLVLATLRPDTWVADPVNPGFDTDDDESRYREWARRFGPTPATLRSLSAELPSLTYRPLISLLMPVYNTDGWMLREAVASVQNQIYGSWQLCVADDGSDRPETLAILDELADHPSVRVVRLPGQSGISGATNAALAVADGDFVAFLDHDDVLKPHALAQVVRWLNADPTLDLVYSDEDKLDEQGRLVQPYLKPDWSPDLLRTNNYLCHLTTIRRSLVEAVGGLRTAFDGSQDYDLVLRVTAVTDRIAHIPEPLYSWRITPGSAAGIADAKPYAIEAGKRAVTAALVDRGLPGRVDDTPWIGRHHPRYPLPGQPKVSIIIPTKDRRDLLERCVESILERSSYQNYELVLVDNETTDGDALTYMAGLPARTIRYPYPFNYARMINLAASLVETDAFLFLNNDTEVINGDWIEALLEHAMRPEVGAVGGRLYFGDDQPQHEGIYVGVLGWATNMNHRGHGLLGDLVRNTTAVTGACTMMRPSVYWRVGGNDERLRVAYNDVDLCMRVRQAGLEVVYTPHARLYHHESSSRSGYEHREEGPLFGLRWEPRQRVDPYYSPIFFRDAAFRIGLGEPERSMPA